MALLSVLPFDPEGRPVAFDTWHDDLQLYLLSDSKDSVSLFDHVSGAAPAPPATADVSTRSQRLSRDATARLAICNHLPATECAHFGEHRTAQALNDAVVARYSSPATAALGRLLLPYLFHELSAFATVADLVTHLRSSDARYCAAVPAEFLPTNQPPMFITLYFIVTRLPDSLRSHLLAAETSAVAVGATRGTLRSPFFEGCSPSPLSSSFASAATADVSVPEDVGAASTSAKRRNSKGKGGRGSGGGSGGGGGGSGSSSGGSGRGGGGGGGGGGNGTGGGGGGSGCGGGSCGGSGGSGGGGTSGGRSGPQCGGPGAEAALGASAYGTPPGTAPAEALHTFTLDSGALCCFFRDSTTLTPLPAPVPVRLADPSGGPVVASSSTVLPCPTIPFGSLSGLHLPLFCTNLVSTGALHDAMVTTTTPLGQRVMICTSTRTRRHLATFTRQPGSSLYTLATEPPQVAASAQVSASGQVAASFSCRLLSHQTLRWHHRLGHPSLLRLRGMHSCSLSLPPLPPSPAPPCLPCVEGRQRAAPHSSSFPPTSAPLQTLHMDVWGPSRVSGQGRERYFLLVVDDYTWYTTVFPLRSKAQLWPRVSLLETSPTLRWTGKVGEALVFRVWRSRAFVRDTSADKLSARAIPCVFLGFVPDAPGWQFYHPTSRRVLPSQDVTFDDSVPFYRLFPYRSAPPPPLPLFLAPGPPPVDPLPPLGPAPSGVSQVDPLPRTAPVQVAVVSGAAPVAASGGAEPGGAGSEGVGSGGLPVPPLSSRVRQFHSAHYQVFNSPCSLRTWSLPPLPPSPAPPCLPCVEGWQHAAPHSSSFPPTTAPLQTLHMDVWGPARVSGQGRERYFLLVVDDYTQYTTVFPLRSKVEVSAVLIPWIRRVRLQLSERFGHDFLVLCLHSDRGGEFSSDLLRDFCCGEGITQSFTLPDSPQQNGIAERRIGLVMEVARTSMIHAAAPHFLWLFAVRYAAHQLNLWPRVSLPETSPTLRWTGKVGDPMEPGAACAGGAGASVAGVGGPATGGVGDAGAGAVDPGAGGTGGTVRPRPYFVPLLQQVLGVPSSTGLPPLFLCPPPDQSQPPLQPASPLPAPSPYSEQIGGLTERREPASRPVSPVRTARRTPRSRPPPVPGTHSKALPRAASPTVARLLATAVTDPSFESSPASALVAELLDFAAACRLDYASALVAESVLASPPPVGGECALGTDVLEDRQEDFECLAAATITGPYSSQWQTAIDAEMASWKVKRPPGSPPASKARYVARGFCRRQGVEYFQTFSPTPKMTTLWVLLHGSLHEEIWLRRPPGFSGTFPAGTQWSLRRPVYGLCQAPREWHDTLRTTLAALGFAPSTADPLLFLRTDTTLPPFYVLVYVDDLVFATADTKALTLVKSELQKRDTCTDLGELRSYLGLQITRYLTSPFVPMV
ncbi:unnamed protein product [Closterium sp. NIES-53]